MVQIIDSPMACGSMRIGLLGGSFDPPHGGHLHISLYALKKLQLDQVWWLVSPGNPLKPDDPWPLEKRLAQSRALISHPRIIATGLEAALETSFTIDTLRVLRRRFKDTNFVWLMGADNLYMIDRWRAWRDIFNEVPVAIFDRPGFRYKALGATAAHVFKRQRLGNDYLAALSRRKAPAWGLLAVPLDNRSSSKIRDQKRVK